MNPLYPLPVLALDEGDAGALDAMATAVAVFGRGRLALHYADDRGGLRRMAAECVAAGAPAVIVVDVDRHPQPKDVLADVADTGFPVAVLSAGADDAIADHALSVGAAAFLPTTLPAGELVALLATLPRTAEAVAVLQQRKLGVWPAQLD